MSKRIADRKNSLLGIPVWERWAILRLLTPKERKVLRLVCSSLQNEIDDFVGLSNVINLHDRLSPEALTFLSQGVFNTIKIKKRCHLNYDEVIHRPMKIKSFQLLPNGIISSDFASKVFGNMKNLENLTLEGIMEDQIPENAPMFLRKLQKFQFENKYPSAEPFDRDLTMRQMYSLTPLKPMKEDLLDGIVKNQITLLKNLEIPNCNEVTFKFRIYENYAVEIFDELELASAISEFSMRNSVERLKVDVRYWMDQRSLLPRVSSYKRRRGNIVGPNLQLHKEIPMTENKIKIQDITVSLHKDNPFMNVPRYPGPAFQILMINYIKGFTATKNLSFSSDFDYLPWQSLGQMITNKSNTLVEISIRASFSGPIDFGIFMECPLLAELDLLNIDKEYKILPENNQHENFPTIVNFGPHPPMMQNLSLLGLCNIRIGEEDLLKLPKFKKLRYLFLYTDLNDPYEEHALSPEAYKALLSIRTLQYLSVVPPKGPGIASQILYLFQLVELSIHWDLKISIVKKRNHCLKKVNRELRVKRAFETWYQQYVMELLATQAGNVIALQNLLQ